MFRIKHSIQTRSGKILSNDTLSHAFSTPGLTAPFIEELIATFDRHGFDKRNGRWWASTKSQPDEIHFWWVEHFEDPAQ